MTQQNQLTSRNRCGNSTISEFREANYSPILGYQDVPDKSIEDAVESIVSFVPRVRDYAKDAKERCRPNTHLSLNESAAIYLYTMANDFFVSLNQTLRVENRSALNPWLAFLKLFITALKKLPSSSAIVWRGVGDISGEDFVENGVHTWWSVNACSPDQRVARCFADLKGTLFCIHAKNGKDITKYSANQDEKEIILMPGTRLRVKSPWSRPEGLSTVVLEEW